MLNNYRPLYTGPLINPDDFQPIKGVLKKNMPNFELLKDFSIDALKAEIDRRVSEEDKRRKEKEMAEEQARLEKEKRAKLKINQLKASAMELIAEAEKIADEHTIGFYFDLAGNSTQYIPKSERDNRGYDESNDGWVTSSYEC